LSAALEEADTNGCAFDPGARLGTSDRFVQGDFSVALKQVLKNYLRFRTQNLKETKDCIKYQRKVVS